MSPDAHPVRTGAISEIAVTEPADDNRAGDHPREQLGPGVRG
jgi:hypothetical protein